MVTLVRPIYQPLDARFIGDDDPVCVWDTQGRCWMFGYKDGQRVKYRNPMLDRGGTP